MHNSSVPLYWRRIRQRNCLIGSKCNKCKTVFYPKKLRCKKCDGNDLQEFKFSGKGNIVSFSEIYNPPFNFEKQIPYTVAIVKLEEGPMLTAQVVDFSKIEIGMEVEACLRKIYCSGKSGMIHYGIKFRVVE